MVRNPDSRPPSRWPTIRPASGGVTISASMRIDTTQSSWPGRLLCRRSGWAVRGVCGRSGHAFDDGLEDRLHPRLAALLERIVQHVRDPTAVHAEVTGDLAADPGQVVGMQGLVEPAGQLG